MSANSSFQRSRKDAIFLLSLLRDHGVFHETLALQDKKNSLMGDIPLLLGKNEPTHVFLSVDFLVHRFFVGLADLSADEYDDLAMDFFDGANLGVLEALSVIYLQNAASLSRVEDRRTTFLERRAIVSRVGIRVPKMDECLRDCVEKEEKMAHPIETDELSKKKSAPAAMLSPAPFPEGASMSETLGEPVLAIRKSTRAQNLIISVFAICLVFVAFWTLFGGLDHKSSMVGSDRPGHQEVQTAEPAPSTSGGIKTGTNGTNVGWDLKWSSSSASDISFEWLTWPFWRDYLGIHSREIFITLMSGLGVMVTGIFLGLKEALRNGVVRLCGSVWLLVSALPRVVLFRLSKETYRVSMSCPFGGTANFWLQILRANPTPVSKALMSLVDTLGREIHELDKQRDDEEAVRNEIIEEAKKALDRLRKERR